MSNMELNSTKIKNYEAFCESVLKIDKKIRFTGIYDLPRVYYKMQEGVTSYLSEFEMETTLNQSLYRWKSRVKLEQKVGLPVFSLTKYAKIYRVTMPYEGETIFCFSTEIDVNINDIIDKVIQFRDSHIKA